MNPTTNGNNLLVDFWIAWWLNDYEYVITIQWFPPSSCSVRFLETNGARTSQFGLTQTRRFRTASAVASASLTCRTCRLLVRCTKFNARCFQRCPQFWSQNWSYCVAINTTAIMKPQAGAPGHTYRSPGGTGTLVDKWHAVSKLPHLCPNEGDCRQPSKGIGSSIALRLIAMKS